MRCVSYTIIILCKQYYKGYAFLRMLISSPYAQTLFQYPYNDAYDCNNYIDWLLLVINNNNSIVIENCLNIID